MPLALDPSETAPVSLRSDADKPEAERPVFLFRHLTRREARKLRDLYREIGDAANADADFEPALDKAILLGLAGWRNMRGRDGKEIPFSPDALDDVLNINEKVELAQEYPNAVLEAEAALKKKYDSEFSPNTASSAPAATAPASA